MGHQTSYHDSKWPRPLQQSKGWVTVLKPVSAWTVSWPWKLNRISKIDVYRLYVFVLIIIPITVSWFLNIIILFCDCLVNCLSGLCPDLRVYSRTLMWSASYNCIAVQGIIASPVFQTLILTQYLFADWSWCQVPANMSMDIKIWCRH